MTTSSTDVPERSIQGLAALDVFYVTFNQVNFYVEDADQENLYLEIFRKHFPDVRIERIFPLGGKANILNHASNADTASMSNRVYLLDKDFDDLLGKKIEQANIFYLDQFCIENYLIDCAGFVELAIEGDPKLKRVVVERQIESWPLFDLNDPLLLELFAMFYFVQKHGFGIPNCKESPERFCKDGELWAIDPRKLVDYKEQINAVAEASTVRPIGAECPKDDRLSDFSSQGWGECVSGKFVLAMLFHLLKRKFRMGSASFQSLSYRLAKSSNVDSFRPIAARIRAHLVNAS